jgi:hypothetical protein
MVFPSGWLIVLLVSEKKNPCHDQWVNVTAMPWINVTRFAGSNVCQNLYLVKASCFSWNEVDSCEENSTINPGL